MGDPEANNQQKVCERVGGERSDARGESKREPGKWGKKNGY